MDEYPIEKSTAHNSYTADSRFYKPARYVPEKITVKVGTTWSSGIPEKFGAPP